MARMAIPSRVWRKKSHSAASTASAIGIDSTRPVDSTAGPITKSPAGRNDSNERGAGPQIALTAARSTDDSPIVTMIIEMMGSPISGRSTSRSMARASATASSTVTSTPRLHGSPV